MKRQMYFYVAALLLVAVPAIALDNLTGNDLNMLYDKSVGKALSYTRGFFDGYTAGVENTNTVLEVKVCIPQGVTNKNIYDVVRKYLVEHPEELHQPAPTLIMKAIQNAWPCKESPEKGTSACPEPKLSR
jgi:Rap1a immunity proteins